MKHLFSFLLMIFLAVSAYAKDNQKLIVTTNPPLSCQNCENKIKKNVRHEKGIKNIETNIKEQRVVITYDPDQTDPKKIAQGFSKIGYTVYKINDCCYPISECCNEGAECCVPVLINTEESTQNIEEVSQGACCNN